MLRIATDILATHKIRTAVILGGNTRCSDGDNFNIVRDEQERIATTIDLTELSTSIWKRKKQPGTKEQITVAFRILNIATLYCLYL
jgi:hypothetical protein